MTFLSAIISCTDFDHQFRAQRHHAGKNGVDVVGRKQAGVGATEDGTGISAGNGEMHGGADLIQIAVVERPLGGVAPRSSGECPACWLMATPRTASSKVFR